jgi:hypothetical protein
MQLAILIKDVFLEVFVMVPLGFGSLWTPMCTFCPQYGVQYLSVLKLVWFPPIDGVISLVMRKKRVCLSKRFQML